jgi:hypothetical protein
MSEGEFQDPLFPGNLVTIAGERWVIGAWHSSGGERSVFLTLLGNSHVVARWPYADLAAIGIGAAGRRWELNGEGKWWKFQRIG